MEPNVYDELPDKLIAKGIPAKEIAYIHDAESDLQKKNLFDAVNAGRVRILLGSTEKMTTTHNYTRSAAFLKTSGCRFGRRHRSFEGHE